jgi:hypothetical protein
VAAELRATIADTVDGRTEDPATTPEAAEHIVLTEMGDPIRLAARYADRPLGLIGPELYPKYVRLLTVLLSTVLPVVTAVAVIADVLDDKSIGTAIGSGVVAVLTVGAQMIAWLTVVFALIERSDKRAAVARDAAWTPEQLPEPKQREKPSAGACASAIMQILMIGLIIWQHTAEPYRIDRSGGGGERVQVLDPALWSGWIWPILAGLAALVTLDLMRFAARRQTLALAAWYAAAEALFALPLAWVLSRQDFFNPAFLNDVNGDWTTPDSFYTAAALVVLAIAVSETFKRFREARRK